MKNETVKQVAGVIGKIAAFGVLLMIPRVVRVECELEEDEHVADGYYDAVRAIMDTNMFTSDKCEMISVIKTNGSKEYYKTVINIVNANMFSSDKIEMIKELD